MTPREIREQKARQYAAELGARWEDTITVERDPLNPGRLVCTVPMMPWHYTLAMVEIPMPVGWKLSPAANCPGLPVNDERNEG